MSGELAGRGNLDGDLSDGGFSCDLGGDGGGITSWPVPGMLPAAGRDADGCATSRPNYYFLKRALALLTGRPARFTEKREAANSSKTDTHAASLQ